MPRGFALGGLMPDEGQPAGFRINRKNGDAVVATVRAKHKLTRRMNLNFGARIVTFEFLGQSGNSLKFLERAVIGIIRERRQRGAHFVNEIDVLSIRMKCEMAGP